MSTMVGVRKSLQFRTLFTQIPGLKHVKLEVKPWSWRHYPFTPLSSWKCNDMLRPCYSSVCVLLSTTNSFKCWCCYLVFFFFGYMKKQIACPDLLKKIMLLVHLISNYLCQRCNVPFIFWNKVDVLTFSLKSRDQTIRIIWFGFSLKLKHHGYCLV